ncbi:MAG: alpha/beta fold hydrolase [Piscinibacter sp.]|nr:alpha/beta fold hydrolase [Piscinibacter sp.]
MLARLQQAITLGLLALALGWAVWFGTHAQPLVAVAGALLALLGYALFLAVEFMLLARQHGDDPAPRADARQLLHAWWGEVLTAPQVFCWRQPFRSQAQADSVGPDAAGRRGMLLVHGFVCNRGFWNPWMAALRERGVPFVALNLEPVFGSIDAYAQSIDAAVRQLRAATGLPPVIVAHSMGGLAVRHWWAGMGAQTPVTRVITIGSPHHGTWLARFGTTSNGRQMRRGGPWLGELVATERQLRGASPYERFTCFYSHCDNIVFPPSTATLPGADNRHLAGTAHVHLAFQPEVFSEACRWVASPSSERDGDTRTAA